MVDGLVEEVEGDTGQAQTTPSARLRFHEATALTSQILERLQHTVRSRVLRHFARHGLLEPHEAEVGEKEEASPPPALAAQSLAGE